MDVNPHSTDHETRSFFCDLWAREQGIRAVDRDPRGDEIRSHASCSKRHYGLIDKLAFIKRSRLQATCQSERDKGAEPSLSPSLPRSPWLKDFKMEQRNPCLLGLMNVPRPRGVKGGFNSEIICIGRVVYQLVVYMRCLEAHRDVPEPLLLPCSCPSALPNLRDGHFSVPKLQMTHPDRQARMAKQRGIQKGIWLAVHQKWLQY